ncbi:MAG: PH domain-containing protein [Thermoplasmata archaeon]
MARGSSNLSVVNAKHLGKYLAQGEVLYVETRATKLFYFPGPIIVLLIMLVVDYSAAAARYGWAAFPGLTAQFARLPSTDLHYTLYVLGFITLLVLIWLFVRYILWIRTIYAVSNHRIIIKRGIASRDIDDIPMNQVRGVDVHQTIAQRMLGYGTVRVSAEFGQDKSIGNEDWKGIPKPFQVQRTIETVMQNPGMPTSPYPPQPTIVYANPPPYQQPPTSPPPK